MESIQFTGTVREVVGKAASKAVRNSDAIPCVMYGGETVAHFSTTWSDVRHLIFTADFKTAEITLDGTTHVAIVKSVQFHPVTEKILHIDFLKLVPGTPIKVTLPLRLRGSSPGVKAGGKLVQSIRKVSVKCYPETLVDQLTIDISKLDLGQSSRVRDIDAVEGVDVTMAGAIPVVMIEIPRAMRAAAAAEAKAAAGPKKKK
ncbi:MAG: 50S ribosomal protein L25 [Saprospiraceae bacterium]|nr:50S ribosomal protein L25 [Saprospiraceae bacterium]